jgi:hypothetical protein
MRQLIVCCDGTWNTPKDRYVTNVRRLHNALDARDQDGNGQLAYYQAGVGTWGFLLNRLVGGGFGLGLTGLSNNVKEAYQWLITNYQYGDSIVLFGFSRGAYTARALAGMISACGLIDITTMDERTALRRIDQAYDQGYRDRQGDRQWRNGLALHYDPEDHSQRVPIRFIGVWDTVGALGIPNYLGWFNLIDPLHAIGFHDLKLNPQIEFGRHAIAMDERRTPYTPALWEGPFAPGQDVKQVWFPGSHKDVGGGHPEHGLSDGALEWMIDEASAAVKLSFNPTTLGQIRPNYLDVQHDDDRGVVGLFEPLVDPLLEPLLELFLQPRPRAVPWIDPAAQDSPDTQDPSIHESVYQRQRDQPITLGRYRPNEMLDPGDTKTVEVFARELWNETGLYLRAGDVYQFTASGEWQDGDIASGPAGVTGLRQYNPLVERFRLAATLIGKLERPFQVLTRNEETAFIATRREEDLPWMSLVGTIANDKERRTGAFSIHERIAIGAGTRYQVAKSGHLYVFANDAWGFYFNNRGKVRLTVTRIDLEPSRVRQ